MLMLDARNIYRKVSRSIYDFSPEQQKNIAAIVWLYRGQQPVPVTGGILPSGAVTEGDAAPAPPLHSGRCWAS